MKLLNCILTENDCCKTSRTIRPQGVMVHSTGANNPALRRYVQPVPSTPNREGLLSALGENRNGNHWNRPGLDVCVHGFIGRLADGSVAAVQTLPWAHLIRANQNSSSPNVLTVIRFNPSKISRVTNPGNHCGT